jgi:carbon-monoxide dehydrogenase medium subunit
VRPETVAEAVGLLRGEDARVLAGGTDLIAQMREGRRRIRRLVDIKGIRELGAVAMLAEGGVMIGAAVSAAVVSRNGAIANDYPAVAQSARLIGGVQVQNRASLGGNICNAAPSADGVPALICHAAAARIAGPAGTRQVPLEELFVGPGKTAIERGELLVSIVLSPPAQRSAATYLRFTPRREMDIAIAGAGTFIRLDQQGTIAEARVALASVGPVPMRAPRPSAGSSVRGRPARFWRRPGGAPLTMRDPSRTRAARPTTAARLSQS